ncbi:MAG: hypothetical protein ABIR32_22160 [Ilumatobacteraceae bacterium]
MQREILATDMADGTARFDLGDAALIIPGDMQTARRELRHVLRDRYEAGLAGIEDPALTDQ